MDENKYLTKTIDEKPAPNDRQWAKLIYAIDNKLAYFAEDMNKDPAEDVLSDSVLTFAATLPSHMGYEITTRWNDRLTKIAVARESGRQFAEQFEDDELAHPSPDHDFPFSPDYLRKTVAACAAGATKDRYTTCFDYQHGYSVHEYGSCNPEIIEKAKAHGLGFRRIYQYPTKLDLGFPGPERLWDLFQTSHYNGRKASVKDPYDHFNKSMRELREEIRKKDNLFSSKFQHWVHRDEAEAEFEHRCEPLTKPLERYAWAPIYRRYYGNHNYDRKYEREYSHKGAQAAYDARNRMETEEEYIVAIDAIMNDPMAVSIEATIQNAEVWSAAYLAALEINLVERRRREAKKAAATQEQEELIAKPIIVQAIERDGAFLIDQKTLKKGLVKRRGYIAIKDITIPIKRLRQWLVLVLKDPATNRMIRNYGKEDWMAVQALESVKRERPNDRSEGPALIFTLPQQGTMRAQSTFLGIEAEYQGGDVHTVEFDVIEEKKITVWTPDLINRLKPVVQPQPPQLQPA